MLKEFRNFIMRGNLVEIAVAFIIGVAFGTVVLAFTNVVLSFIAAIFGSDVSFDALVWTLNETPIPYGAFLTALLNFVIIGWILFLMVKAYTRMRKQPDPATKACEYCRSEIPLEATRCPNCTSQLAGSSA